MHIEKLFNELCAAGLPVVGVSINGEITWGIENPSSDQLRAAAIIVVAHDEVDHAHERRRRLASDTMGMIMDSRLCRVIIEGGDLSGYRLPDIVAAQGAIIRYLWNLSNMKAPAWTRDARRKNDG